MNYYRRVYGRWTKEQVRNLNKFDISVNEGFSSFDILEYESTYSSIKAIIKNARDVDDRRVRAIFNKTEIINADRYFLYDAISNKGYQLSTDILEQRESIYDRCCEKCSQPCGEQSRPFIFRKIPKLGKSNILFSAISASGMLFTTKENYNNYFKRWNLSCQEVLVGKTKDVIENIVQLQIAQSEIPLFFGASEYGKQFDETGLHHGYHDPCDICKRKTYSNQMLDFFPDFASKVDEDIVRTVEWFNDRNHIVISMEFANFLVEIKAIRFNALVPVKNFNL